MGQIFPSMEPPPPRPLPARAGRLQPARRTWWLSAFLLVIGVSAGLFVGLSFVAFQQPEEAARVVRPVITSVVRRPEGTRQLAGVDFDKFWEVWDYVKAEYVREDVSDRELFYGALRGIVDSLDDPYSAFLEPTTSEQFQQDLTGSFEGIGAEIGIRNDRLTIIAPLPGNPAERAGLKAGDVVLTIDELNAIDLPLDLAVRRIRGPRGTTVVLKILRNGEKEPRTFKIVRDTIAIVSVSWEKLTGNLIHLQLKYFNEDTLERFTVAANQISGLRPKGIILDLRNNPGGFLKTAIEVTSFWTGPDRIVVGERQRGGETTGHKPSNDRALFEGIPTVVLINRGSASGAEIVAGALQDYQLATLVGETSFGKGSVQDLKQLDDGSAVKLTIAKWVTPEGRQIEERGIEPDVAVKGSENGSSSSLDPQLDKAIELLKQPVSGRR